MLTCLHSPDQYLSNSYRPVILRQAIIWIGTGIEIPNPLNSAEILSPNKSKDKQDSKMVYPMNGSWYFNKTNIFFSFEEENIGSI